jgi:imidazolonepropionase-like amidohydrolase
MLSCAHGSGARPGRGQRLAIVGATVLHPRPGGQVTIERDATVIISGERIEAVGPAGALAAPAGATTIYGWGRFVVPGLIDSHVHFFQSGNLYTRPDAADFTRLVPYAQEDARNRARLRTTFKIWLASGVTGVADVGGPFWNFDVRDAARASPAAPRVVVAGPLLSMVERPQLDLGDPPIIQVRSPEEARALARRELARRPDFVKVWFIHQAGDDLAAQEAIVRAAAETSHAAGVRLAVHATELATAKAALRAGADILVHSVWDRPVDAEFLALAKERNVLYVPTLFVRMGYQLAFSGQWQPTEEERRLADQEVLASLDVRKVRVDAMPERVRRLLNEPAPVEADPIALANLRAVRDAGIAIAAGTDAGNIGTVHGPSIFRELELMVRAGLSPAEVLAAATLGGARMLGLEKDLGDIAPGKLADLVVLDADPLAGVRNLSRIHRVIKGGQVFDPAELTQR